MNLEDLLKRLVEAPSLSGQEGPAADLLQGILEGEGISVTRAGHNLVFEIGSGAPRLLLLSHLDTVPPGAGWSGDPWKPEWMEGRLTGLGANDAKGCVAAMTGAALGLRSAELPGTLVFAFAAEEETGSGGIEAILPRLGALDAAIVGEPTGLQVCAAQRGMLILRCLARGESAHVAHARLGENAIHKAARDIARLELFRFEGHPLLGAPRAQVTQIGGGIARNLVPDACEFFIDLRTTPNLEHDELLRFFAGQLESEVSIHSDRYLPRATDPAEPVVQAALAAAGVANPVGSATTSDWACLGELPAVKVGPGDTHRSHRPDEYLLATELHRGAAFYAAAALGYLRTMQARKEASHA
ncbi:MAG: M20/M25/M40 family metallo-hydrolase [Acidobacteria bacterium]|nr:M20/M25/M40 family metallo-hydrolase [Acidobacteriota bacterium]